MKAILKTTTAVLVFMGTLAIVTTAAEARGHRQTNRHQVAEAHAATTAQPLAHTGKHKGKTVTTSASSDDVAGTDDDATDEDGTDVSDAADDHGVEATETHGGKHKGKAKGGKHKGHGKSETKPTPTPGDAAGTDDDTADDHGVDADDAADDHGVDADDAADDHGVDADDSADDTGTGTDDSTETETEGDDD